MTTHEGGAARINFAHLEEQGEHLVRLGMLAVRYFGEGTKTTLLKLRQSAEPQAQLVATRWTSTRRGRERSVTSSVNCRIGSFSRSILRSSSNLIVDRALLNGPDLVLKCEGDGVALLELIFGGELPQVIDTANTSLWPSVT